MHETIHKHWLAKLDNWFKISDRKSTFKKEIIGGLSTFLAMMYILSVNPSMLSKSDGIENVSDPVSALFLGTAISSMLATFFMGIFANVPIALAPGMGINAFFTFTVASQSGFNLGYYGALICVFVSGLLYAVIAVTPAREYINKVIPKNLKIIIAAIIGFFLCYVGLNNIGIINKAEPVSGIGANFNPATNHFYPIVIIGTIALIIGLILTFCKIKNSIIIASLISVVMLAIAFGCDASLTVNGFNANAFSLQSYNFKDFGSMVSSIFEAKHWSHTFQQPIAYVAIFTFLYIDFFDTSSTLIAFGHASGLDHEVSANGKTIWMTRANYVDGISTIGGSMLLCSSVTVVSESFSAVNCGARTGFASIITSALFLLSLAIWPIMGPFMPIGDSGQFQPVTGQAIFVTGLSMIGQISEMDWKNKLDIPVFGIGVVFGMLAYSISSGLSWAIFFYVVLHGANYLINRKQKQNIIVKEKMQGPSLGLNILCIISIIFIVFDILTKANVIK